MFQILFKIALFTTLFVNISEISCQPITKPMDLIRSTLQFFGIKQRGKETPEKAMQKIPLKKPEEPINEIEETFSNSSEEFDTNNPSNGPSLAEKDDILIKPIIFRCPVGQRFSQRRGQCVQPFLLRHPSIG